MLYVGFMVYIREPTKELLPLSSVCFKHIWTSLLFEKHDKIKINFPETKTHVPK